MTTNKPLSRNWLDLESPFARPVCRMGIPRAPDFAVLGSLLNPRGDGTAQEHTDVRLWYDDQALHLWARCHTASMDRIRALAARPIPYPRDAWGDDALEVQIDVGLARRRHRHFMLPPNAIPITFTGSNNLQEQGWHPDFSIRVNLEETAWIVFADFPFTMLDRSPEPGEIWGFNLMRVNRNEPSRYVQWAPTFGDALRPEIFGEIQFSGPAANRAESIAAYARYAEERKVFFANTINSVSSETARLQLGVTDWSVWADGLAWKDRLVPLRWEDVTPGAEGIPEQDRTWILDTAEAQIVQVERWTQDPPDPVSFGLEPLEALGDAWLLTSDRRFVATFEKALAIHSARIEQIRRGVSRPDQLPYSGNPYHDSQIIRAEMIAYVYLSMGNAGLAPETHAAMMELILRSCRFAAYNIASAYTYGNHQVYESGGLAAVAALFPQFPESDEWARIASRSIRLHLEREVFPDGGYGERCGYHSVAMSYVMHAVATIRLNGAESRFAELMSPSTLAILERMHEWVLALLAPDGTLPAFGDYSSCSQLRFLRRGSVIFGRSDFAWPLQVLAPAFLPPQIEPRLPRLTGSQSLTSSAFTVFRDDYTPDAFYLAVDHGPLASQHSHIDTLSFVAYAQGRPIALDSGMSSSYEDPRYVNWFRALRAHNVIAIDAFESEKIARQIDWQPGEQIDRARFESRAYSHALGVVHERTFFFVKSTGWFIHDRLIAPAGFNGSGHDIDWVFHTPFDLKVSAPGLLEGTDSVGGLLVLSGLPETLETPRLTVKPASVFLKETSAMRPWDVGRRISIDRFTPPITMLTWRHKHEPMQSLEFATFLLPYQGKRPEVRLNRTVEGFVLNRTDASPLVFKTSS